MKSEAKTSRSASAAGAGKTRSVRKRTGAEKADIQVARAAAPMRDSAPVRALGWLSEIADQPPLITVCAATFAAGLILRNGRMARAGGRMLAAELLATKLKDVIKRRVDRTRPSVLAHGGEYEAEKGHDHAKAMTSFPSGHTAGAVAVARAYAREYPEHAPAAYAAAAAIGAIQIPRCRHYPTDIAAGALVGLAAEKAVRLAEGLVAKAAGAERRPASVHRGVVPSPNANVVFRWLGGRVATAPSGTRSLSLS